MHACELSPFEACVIHLHVLQVRLYHVLALHIGVTGLLLDDVASSVTHAHESRPFGDALNVAWTHCELWRQWILGGLPSTVTARVDSNTHLFIST